MDPQPVRRFASSELAVTSGTGECAELRTNYGPRRQRWANINGQQWTLARSRSRSAIVTARSGGQGVASSNLASPTSKRPIRMPNSSFEVVLFQDHLYELTTFFDHLFLVRVRR